MDNINFYDNDYKTDNLMYRVICTYRIGYRHKLRIVKENINWEDASKLQHRLQIRAVQQKGIKWSSWTGRIYHRELMK
jgi:hypothetical protein